MDPKSVVCVYFKQNLCQKGDKCKFSHDLTIERKSEKRNIYEDTREADTMENWDEQKLEDVINRKHGEDNVKKNQTQIVSSLKMFVFNKDDVFFLSFFFLKRYANTLSKQLRTKRTVGFGRVPTARRASIDTRCRRVSRSRAK